ncbi:MAG: 30S ribosomal protein S8 [Verrucomicrobia bacterium]|nr:30S ribosomal protein S8 [Verrucomicrobiota bacterium]
MNLTDPIADMLMRLRNAGQRGKPEVRLPHSRIKSDMARVLKREGYIEDFKVQKDGKKLDLQITLKGKGEGRAITGLRRISTPGRRKYVGVRDIPRVLGGMGVAILSTPQGVMAGHDARKKNVGGEVLCHVW